MKRFTETSKWLDPWFRGLALQHKAFWFFICENCDCAGVWEVDIEMASFLCGVIFSHEELLHVFQGRIRDLGNGKWWIEKFIDFQYKQLNPNCYPHTLVIARIQKHNLPIPTTTLPHTLPSRVGKWVHTTHKDKDKDKDKDKEGEVQEGAKNKRKANSREEVVVFVRELGLPETDGHYCFDHWEGNGWKNSGKPICDWKATIRSWQRSKILPSLKQGLSSSAFQRPLSAHEIKTRIQAIIAERNKIYQSFPTGQIPEAERRQMNELQKRRDQLEAQLTE